MKNRETLRPSYNSFKDFCSIHKVTQAEIDLCFGKNYFVRNPRFKNALVINRLINFYSGIFINDLSLIGVKYIVHYPTFDTVEFRMKKLKGSHNTNLPMRQAPTVKLQSMKPTLNVKKITNEELSKKWGIPVQFLQLGAIVYVRCNGKGIVNWGPKTLVYKVSELVGRNNVIVHS